MSSLPLSLTRLFVLLLVGAAIGSMSAVIHAQAGGDGDGERVTICHAPGGKDDQARTKQVGAGALDEHLAHGDHEGECESDANGEDANGEVQEIEAPDGKVVVCHTRGAQPRTKIVGEDDLADHLDHGDHEGPCSGELALDDVPEGWLAICHVPDGNPDNAHTLIISAQAGPTHDAHGDDIDGPCDQGAVNVRGTGGEGAVSVCHRGRTRNVPSGAAASHFAHGDAEGACDDGDAI